MKNPTCARQVLYSSTQYLLLLEPSLSAARLALAIEMTDSGHSDIIDLTLSDEDSSVVFNDESATQQAADFDEPFVKDEPATSPATTSDFDLPL